MRIFLDSGNPEDTKIILEKMPLDGQTTNPSLVAKNPVILEKISSGNKLTEKELLYEYKRIVTEISELIPFGSISIEVYADKDSASIELYRQALEMNTWIPNAHIKLPITKAGIEAAVLCLNNNLKVNMTLCFTQEQALIVHSATRGAKKGDVFVSPFIGRIDDKGLNGVDLIKNIRKMYNEIDSTVEILAASIRSKNHLEQVESLGADITTVPFALLNNSDDTEKVESSNLKNILYQELDFNKSWQSMNIEHDLTNSGLQKFADDWNKIFK